MIDILEDSPQPHFLMDVLREHRGKVIYIPVVMPDNVFIGIAHALGIAAAVVMFVVAASQSWLLMEIQVPSTSEYDPTLSATITFGLRSMHILYCEQYNSSVGSDFNGCGFEDVFYSSCSAENDWCKDHGNTAMAFWGLIFNAFFVLGTCVTALIKLGLLPSGFLMSAWIGMLAVASFKQESIMFEPSTILQSWMDYGTVTTNFLWAYNVCVASCMMLALAVILSTIGYIRAGRADAEREVEEQRQRDLERRSEQQGDRAAAYAVGPEVKDAFTE